MIKLEGFKLQKVIIYKLNIFNLNSARQEMIIRMKKMQQIFSSFGDINKQNKKHFHNFE